MVLPAIIGGAQALLGIGSAVFGQPPVDTSGIRQTALQNASIRAQNARTEEIYKKQLERVRLQYGRNEDAASRAYNTLQLKEQEQLEAYLSQQEGMVKALTELQGRYGAREVYGKSASRMASMPERDYGVAMRTLYDNLRRFSAQTERDMQEIARQQRISNEDAFAGVSIPPMLQAEVPYPSVQMPSQANLGLKIGSAILGGLGTITSLRPPAAGGGGNNMAPRLSPGRDVSYSDMPVGMGFGNDLNMPVGMAFPT